MFTGRLAILVRRVVIPAAVPQIAVGLRGSPSRSILMVISEMVASTNGLGYFVLQAQRTFRWTTCGRGS